MAFLFTHNGRTLESDLTPEEAGMDDGDEIVAVEMMDLTQTPAPDDAVCYCIERVASLKYLFVVLGGVCRTASPASAEELD